MSATGAGPHRPRTAHRPRAMTIGSLIVAVWAVFATPVTGQTTDGGGDGAWRRWSPLAPVADLVRPSAPVSVFSLVLLTPTPHVGLAWTAGNPAALADDVSDSYTEFLGSVRGENGALRRPLDAGRVGGQQVSASGWRPLGTSGGVVGGVTVEHASSSEGAAANAFEPYGMSPHVFADSSGADLGRTMARLEGAGGWRLGPWGLGLALGHQSWDTRTGVTQTPRFHLGALSGAVVGMTRDAASGRVTLGAHGRWRSEVQRLSLSTRQAETTGFVFEGYGEPVIHRLAARQGYARRVEREGGAAALSAEVRAAGLRWIVYGEASRLEERQFDQLTTNYPPTDDWDARGHAAGIAAEAGTRDRGTHVAASLRWSTVSGDAKRAGLEDEGVLFEADESVIDGAVDLRVAPGNGWKAGAHISILRENRDRTDRLARIRSSVQAWRPGLALEAAHDVGSRLALGVGAGLAWYTPSGGIPDPSQLGAGYRTWIGPDLSYMATGSQTLTGLFTLRWLSPGGQAVSLEARYQRASARETAVSIPLAPTGTRSAWNMVARWSW